MTGGGGRSPACGSDLVAFDWTTDASCASTRRSLDGSTVHRCASTTALALPEALAVDLIGRRLRLGEVSRDVLAALGGARGRSFPAGRIGGCPGRRSPPCRWPGQPCVASRVPVRAAPSGAVAEWTRRPTTGHTVGGWLPSAGRWATSGDASGPACGCRVGRGLCVAAGAVRQVAVGRTVSRRVRRWLQVHGVTCSMAQGSRRPRCRPRPCARGFAVCRPDPAARPAAATGVGSR